jgi:hypothetical protein
MDSIPLTVLLVENRYTDYVSVSKPLGRGPVPGPGINYTGLQEVNIL